MACWRNGQGREGTERRDMEKMGRVGIGRVGRMLFGVALAIMSPLRSQEALSKWQTLEWSADDSGSVSFYEVIVERLDTSPIKEKNKDAASTDDSVADGKRFYEYTRKRVNGDEHSVKMDPLLPSGEYRYKVMAYNLLNLLAAQSSWLSFSIVEAKQPVLHSVSIDGNVITVTGKNLFLEDDKNKGEGTRYELINESTKLAQPLKADEADGKRALLRLEGTGAIERLEAGKYRVAATDASGLASKETSGIFTIKANGEAKVAAIKEDEDDSGKEAGGKRTRASGIDGSISIGYACPITIEDDTKMLDILQTKSALFRISCTNTVKLPSGGAPLDTPNEAKALHIGIAGSIMYTRVATCKNDGNMAIVNMLFVCQMPIIKKFRLEGRAGGGVMYLNNIKGDTPSGCFLDASAGISVQFSPFSKGRLRNFYADAGADYTIAFMPKGVVTFIVPAVSAGYRF